MKTTRAFSIEEDIYKTILEYKDKYKLSSASSALERIILVELPKRTDLEEIKNMIVDLKNNSNSSYTNETAIETEEIQEEKPQIKNSKLGDSFKNSIASMPE